MTSKEARGQKKYIVNMKKMAEVKPAPVMVTTLTVVIFLLPKGRWRRPKKSRLLRTKPWWRWGGGGERKIIVANVPKDDRYPSRELLPGASPEATCRVSGPTTSPLRRAGSVSGVVDHGTARRREGDSIVNEPEDVADVEKEGEREDDEKRTVEDFRERVSWTDRGRHMEEYWGERWFG